jgi:hypothetical protein
LNKHDISQLYYLNREIEQQKRRLCELETSAYSCTSSITRMPHGSGVSDKIGKYAVEIAELKALIELNIQKCWHELNRLNRYIQAVDDSLTRQVLALRYINGLSWLQVAMSIGGDNKANTVRMIAERYISKF